MRHHLILGVAILLVVLGLGLWSARYLDQAVGQVQKELRAAFDLAAEGDLELAHTHTEKASERWEKTAHFAACLLKHQDLEQVDELFCELNAWYQIKNSQEYARVCGSLSSRFYALADGEKPCFYNLF